MKISVVSGGFDPIHSGHISYLKSAKEILAEDIQTIVDSKNGYDKDLFREGPGGWLDTFLYGKEGTRYEGIFSWQKWDGNHLICANP